MTMATKFRYFKSRCKGGKTILRKSLFQGPPRPKCLKCTYFIPSDSRGTQEEDVPTCSIIKSMGTFVQQILRSHAHEYDEPITDPDAQLHVMCPETFDYWAREDHGDDAPAPTTRIEAYQAIQAYLDSRPKVTTSPANPDPARIKVEALIPDRFERQEWVHAREFVIHKALWAYKQCKHWKLAPPDPYPELHWPLSYTSLPEDPDIDPTDLEAREEQEVRIEELTL